MYAIALRSAEFGLQLDLLESMYRLRKRVFRDRLDWSVSISGELELDVFDALNPAYLLIVSDRREVVGSVRLLPTTGPTMLSEEFPLLLGATAMPQSLKILESSRFCVDTAQVGELGQNLVRRATLMLFAAMLDYLTLTGAEAIVTVTDMRMERILRRSGWPLRRISDPVQIGDTMALAGFLDASGSALERVRRLADLPGPVIELAGLSRSAA